MKTYHLLEMLSDARRGGYAVGSFSPRYTPMIAPVLAAAQAMGSPAIVQISANEFGWFGITPKQFADEYFRQLKLQNITVPTILHLDHTKDPAIIRQAIEAGFQSVMIDASAKPFAENADISRSVAEYAHRRGVWVEAELGTIGTTDRLETDNDEELFTKPDEAQRFVALTGVDTLAVSVGTAHGVYKVKQPRVDMNQIRAIAALTDIPLVLHGGSGVPAEMMQRAFGHVCKVNIATDLEQAFLAAIHGERMSDEACRALPAEELCKGQAAVQAVVEDKIANFVLSRNQANRKQEAV